MKRSIIFLFVLLSSGWLYANHWTPEDAQFEDNMTLTSVIQIDGEEQHSDQLEVGVFCGDQCRGSVMPMYFPPTQRYIYQLTVFGETGDLLTFKLYDHETEAELDLQSPESVMFNGDGYGTLAVPYELYFTTTDPGPSPDPDAVVIILQPGWNWISYLLKTERPLAEALVNLTPEADDLIKGMAGTSMFKQGSWQGNLDKMVPGVGYMYYSNSNVTKTFTYPSE